MIPAFLLTFSKQTDVSLPSFILGQRALSGKPPAVQSGYSLSAPFQKIQMNTRFLEAFVWTVKLGSFRAAADKLRLTQAAISGRIASLEADFGKRLFDRGIRELQITPAGYALLAHAESLLEEERLMREALTGKQVLQGYVRLGMIESIVYSWLEPFLRRVHAAHPELELELTADPTARLHELLTRGVIDVALQTDTVIGKDIRNQELGKTEMAWVALNDGKVPPQARLSDMADIPIITFTRGSQPHKAVVGAFESIRLRPAKLHCVTSLAVITRLLYICGGMASLPVIAVRKQLAEGVFRIVECDVSLPPLNLVASYRNGPNMGIGEALAELASEEMRAFSASPDA